jgi:hypothetical protein
MNPRNIPRFPDGKLGDGWHFAGHESAPPYREDEIIEGNELKNLMDSPLETESIPPCVPLLNLDTLTGGEKPVTQFPRNVATMDCGKYHEERGEK